MEMPGTTYRFNRTRTDPTPRNVYTAVYMYGTVGILHRGNS